MGKPHGLKDQINRGLRAARLIPEGRSFEVYGNMHPR
jgi:hypothetical protein